MAYKATILENTKLSDLANPAILSAFGGVDIDSLDLVTISNNGNNGLSIGTTSTINQEIILENVTMTDLEESDFSLRTGGTDGDDILIGTDEDDYG